MQVDLARQPGINEMKISVKGTRILVVKPYDLHSTLSTVCNTYTRRGFCFEGFIEYSCLELHSYCCQRSALDDLSWNSLSSICGSEPSRSSYQQYAKAETSHQIEEQYFNAQVQRAVPFV